MSDDLVQLKRQLADMLLKAREASGLSRDQAAEALECDPSKVWRFETADTSIVRRSELRELIKFYKVSSGKARKMEELWRAIREAKSRKRRKSSS